VWAILAKLLGSALTGEQSQALSTLGILPILLALVLSKRTVLRGASRKGLLLALAGGVVTCLGNVALYAALGRGEKVATVVSLTALYPLTTIVLAVVILRERLNGVQLGGIALSFIAIWLFNIQSGAGLLSATVAYALLPILFWGLSGFLQKVATNHLAPETAAFVYLAAFIPVGLFYGASEPWPGALSVRHWAIVLAIGFFLASRAAERRPSSRRSAAFIRSSACRSRCWPSAKRSASAKSSRSFARSPLSRRCRGKGRRPNKPSWNLNFKTCQNQSLNF
jgi:transporter family protein